MRDNLLIRVGPRKAHCGKRVSYSESFTFAIECLFAEHYVRATELTPSFDIVNLPSPMAHWKLDDIGREHMPRIFDHGLILLNEPGEVNTQCGCATYHLPWIGRDEA